MDGSLQSQRVDVFDEQGRVAGSYPILLGPSTIGRRPDMKNVLRANLVSREHARLDRVGDHVVRTDPWALRPGATRARSPQLEIPWWRRCARPLAGWVHWASRCWVFSAGL